MKHLRLLALFAISLVVLGSCNKSYNGESPSYSAYSTERGVEGTVVEEGDNEWFVIKTSAQYVVIEAQGVGNFRINDKVYGDFHGFQGRNIYNASQNRDYKAWVEGYFSAYNDAVEYMKDH